MQRQQQVSLVLGRRSSLSGIRSISSVALPGTRKPTAQADPPWSEFPRRQASEHVADSQRTKPLNYLSNLSRTPVFDGSCGSFLELLQFNRLRYKLPSARCEAEFPCRWIHRRTKNNHWCLIILP